MALTANYQATLAGIPVASGEGEATIGHSQDPRGQMFWAIGADAITAPALIAWHPLGYFKDKPFGLNAGEVLWIKGPEIVAVTADNPAAGAL